MFGYVVPIRHRLSEQAKAQYRADYCGLCRCLGKRYGFTARFLVSYDMTFLYALLASAEDEGEQARCFCPANPFCKKQCRRQDRAMLYCADVSVLLSAEKLRDTVADETGWKRLGARLALGLLRGKAKLAGERLPRQAQTAAEQLQALRRLEAAQCASIDRTADTFAVLLRELVEQQTEASRILRQLLYHTGRYLYLVDALDDLERDVQAERYNPLRFRYRLEEGRLSREDQTQFLQSVEASVQQASAALDLLPQKSHRELLENIINYGMPAVLQAVAAGRFHRRRNRSTDERPL